ncbi:MAG: 23S rRNA (guanosine(2251)-2'-O)-methyltransferase RlmB [Firmicutes bacterium HGW-Firmicutes-13]|nr:MAG: 23S rRNA (guanosine(2251)-2'-O)-methyltransferase RlmB [Firmicutes bacterium HGW-Firmicutes-13]
MNKSDLILGRQPVMEALKARSKLQKILIAEGAAGLIIREIEGYARGQGIPLEKVERKYIDKISDGFNHQGVAAVGFEFNYAELDDIFYLAERKGEHPFLLLLDQIQDPQNLGALIRTAEAAGAHGVVIPNRRAAQVTPAVFRASAGAISYVPVARVKNLNYLIDELKKKGLWIYGTDAQGIQLYYEVDYHNPLAVIIGSEGKGISRILREKCDYLVKIPMKGKVSSLNASAAGAVLLYEVLRQRGL